MDRDSVARIAAGLTKARKRLLLALPANGDWGRAPSRSVAKRLWWMADPPLIEHRHCPPSPDEEWCLSDIGIAVRQFIQEQSK